MKERGVLFSVPMVRALLDGSKTQTRRVLKHRWPHLWQEPWYVTGRVLGELPSQPGAWMEFRHRTQDAPGYDGSPASTLIPCPHGMPGDRLWVREAWRTVAEVDAMPPRDLTAAHRIWFEADDNRQPGAGKLRPSMFMPRWASRITLEIVSVRVERLNDISDVDALAEGIDRHDVLTDGDAPPGFHRGTYERLWERINGAGSWAANPWVWCVTFRRVQP